MMILAMLHYCYTSRDTKVGSAERAPARESLLMKWHKSAWLRAFREGGTTGQAETIRDGPGPGRVRICRVVVPPVAYPVGYTGVCGSGRGHGAHGACGPSWHTAWHMCRTRRTDVGQEETFLLGYLCRGKLSIRIAVSTVTGRLVLYLDSLTTLTGYLIIRTTTTRYRCLRPLSRWESRKDLWA